MLRRYHLHLVALALLGLCACVRGETLADAFAAHFRDADPNSLVRHAEFPSTQPPAAARWVPQPGYLAVTQPNAAQPFRLGFRLWDSDGDAGFQRLTWAGGEWYGSPYWTGPDWTRIGRDWHHPGENTPSVRCFRCPRDGRVTITGAVRKAHLEGDGIRATIRHRGKSVWTAELEGTDSKGRDPNLALDVHQGDAIRFIVHKRGGIACDTTYWDPIITYAGGEVFQASKAFGDQQGKGDWFYEMSVDQAAVTTRPCVLSLGRDLSLRETDLTGPQTIELSSATNLPALVLTDAPDKSGVCLAWDGGAPWRATLQLSPAGLLEVSVASDPTSATPLRLRLAAYNGPRGQSATALAQLVSVVAGDAQTGIPAVHEAYAKSVSKPASPDLLLMTQLEWHREDKLADTSASYAAAVSAHLDRARALLDDLSRGREAGFLVNEGQRLQALAAEWTRPGHTVADWRSLYLRVRSLKRDLMLQAPELPRAALLFCKRLPPNWSHEVAQYFGWRQRPGGGLFVLEQPGRSLACRELLAGALPKGNVLAPTLSYDGKRVLFSFVTNIDPLVEPQALPADEAGPDEAYFHLYEAGVDGTGLHQLTRGPYDDMMAKYLPDGDIIFCSTRRRGYSRCFGPEYSKRWHSYTLHRMAPDGTNLHTLSFNDVSEWHPSVLNDGRIVYARWDYIDRDAVTHQNLWAVRPDGTDPVAVWGNANPAPHCTFQPTAIPGSDKIAFIGSAHHSVTGGPLCVLDSPVDNNSHAALTRITPGPFPEAESGDIPAYCESPCPLSERMFLVAYSPVPLVFQGGLNADNALGLYLMDASGNRELLYRDPQISSTSPLPLIARPTPPVIPSALPGDRPKAGEFLVTDIYQGLGGISRGTVKELRVVQIFPKSTYVGNDPAIGFAGEENGRAILGTVPVESDGSAHFRVPQGKAVLFQALDANGFAVQTMRSLTYVQPGERTSCVGCHESRTMAPRRVARSPRRSVPLPPCQARSAVPHSRSCGLCSRRSTPTAPSATAGRSPQPGAT